MASTSQANQAASANQTSSSGSNGVTVTNGMTLVKKKNTKSSVWLHFGLRATANGDIVEREKHHPICRKCGAPVPAKDGNTSNLHQHLRDHHPTLYAALPTCASTSSRSRSRGESSRTTQPTIVESVLQSTKYARGSPQAKEMTRAITYYLAKDAVPLYTVERAGFKHMVSKLNPRYELPSRKVFSSKEIPTLYTNVRSSVMAELKQIKYYALTTDLWTSGACEPYITLTVHYIDGDWCLRSKCLDTVAMFEDHTGENIAHSVSDILANWEISTDNLTAATTDSGSNVISAFRTLGLIRISCFGHNLDLAVRKALDSSTRIKRALDRCRSIVHIFHRSWKKSRDLTEKQQLLGIPEHKLKLEVSTRWGSAYEMISRVIEQQQAISAVLAEDRKYWYAMPTDDELHVLETVVEVLKDVFFLTDALSGETDVTASSLRCITMHLMSKLSPCSSDNHIAANMKQVMKDDLEGRNDLPKVSEALDICSFLDPRFKTRYLEDKTNTMSLITEECISFLEVVDNSTEPHVDEQPSSNPPLAKKLRGLSAIIKNFEEENGDMESAIEEQTTEQRVNTEITSYLDFPVASADTSPLLWWKTECRRFPALSHLAVKYLCIPATSVPSERVFSRGGQIVSARRRRLLPKNVKKLIFLSQNLD